MSGLLPIRQYEISTRWRVNSTTFQLAESEVKSANSKTLKRG